MYEIHLNLLLLLLLLYRCLRDVLLLGIMP